jgi:hypothetical protein
MPISRAPKPTTVSANTTRVDRSSTSSTNPLYGVAMLKIALELKKSDDRPMDELISGVLTKMKLSETDFRRFLAANGGLLMAVAQKRSA